MEKKIRIYAISEYQILATDDKGHWYRAKKPIKNINVNDMVSMNYFYELDEIESESREYAKHFRELIDENPSLF